MSKHEDIRWEQCFANYEKALKRLEEGVNSVQKNNLSDLEKQGLIQAFEFTHELAWKTIKDYFIYQGNNSITGSRDATRTAFANGLLKNGEAWMEMIKSRNESSHTYNEETANDIYVKVLEIYYLLFKEFEATMKAKLKQE